MFNVTCDKCKCLGRKKGFHKVKIHEWDILDRDNGYIYFCERDKPGYDEIVKRWNGEINYYRIIPLVPQRLEEVKVKK